ncbi:uncharacterized protein METZ01_LOCUS355915 [marine metagenome]|uniref:Uncharacterized protein n=1 Tax=marine metagenome TaxID=408172 RepID=A0A382S2A4_9ZZZZ
MGDILLWSVMRHNRTHKKSENDAYDRESDSTGASP